MKSSNKRTLARTTRSSQPYPSCRTVFFCFKHQMQLVPRKLQVLELMLAHLSHIKLHSLTRPIQSRFKCSNKPEPTTRSLTLTRSSSSFSAKAAQVPACKSLLRKRSLLRQMAVNCKIRTRTSHKNSLRTIFKCRHCKGLRQHAPTNPCLSYPTLQILSSNTH